MRKKKARRKKHAGRNKHHLRPRSRGGTSVKSNLLLIRTDVHRNLHLVFGNRTLEEIIELLIRVKRAKDYQKAA